MAELDRTRDETLFIYFYFLHEAVSNSGCVEEDDQMRVNTALENWQRI
jgi:hypothetical protein